jgi:general nucleoside transport system permease protein
MKRPVLVKRAETEIRWTGQLLYTGAGIGLALVVSAIMIAWLGHDPFLAMAALVQGAFGSLRAWDSTLIKMAPLLTAALGVTVAFRAGLWSIGNFGQFLLGGLGAALAALAVGNMPGGWALALLAGALFGALWSLVPGLLRAFWSVNEVVTTLMFNYIAVLFINYLVTGPIMDRTSGLSQTARIAATAQLPILLQGTRIHLGVLLALALAFAVHLLLGRTSFGFELRVVGLNDRAGRFGGISVSRVLLMTMLLSGALCGLAGAGEILGLYRRMLDGVAGGYEYTPIIVALLGNLNPLALIAPAVLFAGLLVGARSMQVAAGLPTSIVAVMQGLIVLFVIFARAMMTYRIEWRTVAPAADATAIQHPPAAGSTTDQSRYPAGNP